MARTNATPTVPLRVSVPAVTLFSFDQYRRGSLRGRVFAAALLRMIELTDDRREAELSAYLDWCYGPRGDRGRPRKATSFAVPPRLASMFETFLRSVPASPSARWTWTAVAIHGLIGAPTGLFSDTCTPGCSSLTVALHRFHAWEQDDPGFVEAVTNLYRAAGEPPPDFGRLADMPQEPDHHGLPRAKAWRVYRQRFSGPDVGGDL